jgi:hypothetical protein
MKNLFGYFLIVAFVACTAQRFSAAQQKEAHVTQVIRDVRVLAHNSAPRPATVNQSVFEGNAVRTGGESRAELTFADQTLTRIGANSVFSFGDGAKEFDLASGAMLLAAPKSAGTVRVNTAAATAAISGFLCLFESHKNSWNKFILLEGQGCVRKNGNVSGDCITLHGGDMLLYKDGKFTDVKHIDVLKITQTAGLLTDFGKLPKWCLDALQAVIDAQQNGGGPAGGYTDPTGQDSVDEKTNAGPTPPPLPTIRPIRSPPSSIQGR